MSCRPSLCWARSTPGLAVLPALAAFLVPPLVRSRNQNTKLLVVLAALCTVNVTFYWALSRANPGLARSALLAGVNLVLLLVTIIGGRIVPAFTSSALKQRDADGRLRTWPAVDAAAVTAMVGVLLIDMAFPEGRVAGAMALVAAVEEEVGLNLRAGHGWSFCGNKGCVLGSGIGPIQIPKL